MKKIKTRNRAVRGISRRQQLEAYGELCERKEILLCYGAVIGTAVLCGIGMSLSPGCLAAAAGICILQVPRLYFQYKKARLERRRFQDANAYMAQVAQSFAGNGKILMSLQETRDTFPAGRMRSTLTRAVSHIEQSCDMELAEREALGFFYEEYDCERIRMLHDFLEKAESRGGSCEAEFGLLENIRRLWEKNALNYQNTVVLARNLVAFEYLLLMLVCMFMLHQFPAELSIIHMPLVQGLNAFLVVCFFLVFCRMDKKCGRSMLRDARRMDDLHAGVKIKYVREFQGKKSLLRQLPFAAFVLALSLAWYGAEGGRGILAGGFAGSLLLLFAGKLRCFYTLQIIRSEIKAVFPGWLFDVLLLVQSENVSVALAKSIEKAPAVLKGELKKLQMELEENPLSPDAFLSFLAEYRLPEVAGIMRKLYALSRGTGAGGEVMNQIIDMNMSMLAEAENRRLRLKGDLFSLYYMLPTVPVMICMAGYGAALMVLIFQNIMTVI